MISVLLQPLDASADDKHKFRLARKLSVFNAIVKDLNMFYVDSIKNIDFAVKPVICDGIEACRMALLKKGKNLLDGNFIEGMACIGGCIGGAGCLTHGEKNKTEVDKYGHEAKEKKISDAVNN